MIKVLWVEEEQDSLRYERGIAIGQGWDITSASTVSEAMDLVSKDHFDLIVADLILPPDEFAKARGSVDVNAGIRFLEWIRSATHESRTPPTVMVVVITAVVSPETKSRVAEKLVPSQYYINKPLRRERYLELIHELNGILGQN
jgi:CheY-like chemotaxis protein